MKQKSTGISLFDPKSVRTNGYRTAVSLHCHTSHSKESLDFVPRYVSRIPVISSLFKREAERYLLLNGKDLNLAGWYWTPPLGAKAVLESETGTMEENLGVTPLVSLTDHDTIAAADKVKASRDVPISLEWTMPVNGGAFHLGVHNLPLPLSGWIVDELLSYTRQPEDVRLPELFSLLNDHPATLIVLNHPLSDFNGLGIERLRGSVVRFLERHKKSIHALEINGHRPWQENEASMALARRFGLPVVSGGDRHGGAPNTILNLTNATTFSEFVAEIRFDKATEILIMPDYWRNLSMRKLASVADFFRFYAERPDGEKCWTDRVFVGLEEGGVSPLSSYWNDMAPVWVKTVMWLIGLVGTRCLRSLFHLPFSQIIGPPFEVVSPAVGHLDLG